MRGPGNWRVTSTMTLQGGTACGVPPYFHRSGSEPFLAPPRRGTRPTRSAHICVICGWGTSRGQGACHPKRVALLSGGSSVIQRARRCTVAPLLRDEIPVLDPGNPTLPALDPRLSTRRDRGPGPSPPLVPRRLRDRSRATELDPPRWLRRSRPPNGGPWCREVARRQISRFVHSAFPGKPTLTRAIDDRWT
jgi:hypothetical protein